MKRCPTCNRTFEEDWLAFCTQDGTTLVDDQPSRSEPPPTIMAPGPPSGSQSQPFATPPAPGSWNQPSGGLGSGPVAQPQPIQSGWQPPPPPAYASGQNQGIAIASMCCGIFSVTIGWCCYMGTITSIVAISLGIYQLTQIKNDPAHNTGKPFAITGIVTGSLYFVFLAVFILVYGGLIFMGSLGK
jgi:Domain of unknown function (DUF4190)